VFGEVVGGELQVASVTKGCNRKRSLQLCAMSPFALINKAFFANALRFLLLLLYIIIL